MISGRRAIGPGRRLGILLALALLAIPVLAVARAPFAPGTASGGTTFLVSTDALSLRPGTATRPVAGSAPVDLEVALVPSHVLELRQLDAGVIDPASPSFHHFLTEPEFEAHFRPSGSEVEMVADYFGRFGGHVVGATPDALGVRVRLTVQGAESALGVRLASFAIPGGSAGVTAIGGAQVPLALRGVIAGIGGLTDLRSPRVGSTARSIFSGESRSPTGPGEIVTNASSGQWWFTGTDYAQAYQEARLFPGGSGSVGNASFATPSAVATILMSGYNDSTSSNLAPFDPMAVAAYFNDTFPASWPQPTVTGIPIGIQGVSPPLPGPTGTLQDTTGNVDENSIDLEMAGSLAPGATLVNFYFAASLFAQAPDNATGYQNIADDFAECLAQALNHSYGSARLAAVTNSYGLPDLSDSLWNSELEHAAAIGVTVVAASGDQGNAPESQSGYFQGPNPTWPGTAAYNASGVVAVGGITVNLSATPTGSYSGGLLTDPFDASVTGFTEQTAWYDTTGPNLTGTEGGASTVAPEPPWQRSSAAQPAIVNATVAQGLGALARAEPDLAFPANDTLAYTGTVGTSVTFDLFQGTSIAAPILAGLLAELTAVVGHPFGFVDPELYRIGSYYAANPGSSDPFEDVTLGRNYLFSAAPGWDPVTGWGTLDPVRFLAADANATVRGFVYTGPSPGLPPVTTKHPSSTNPLTVELVLLGLVVGVIVAVSLAFAFGGTRRSDRALTLPAGTYTPTPGSPPPPYGRGPLAGGAPATFLCPYCGSVRPAEPVRCPACGAF